MPPPLDADQNSPPGLHHRLLQLQQENDDLQTMLDMAIEHSDILLETLRAENQQLTLQLKKSVDPFEMVAEALPVGLIIARIFDGHIVYGNAAICQFFGLSAPQLKTRQITDFCYSSADSQQLTTVIHNQQAFKGELRWLQSDGSASGVMVSLQPFVFNHEPATLIVIHTPAG